MKEYLLSVVIPVFNEEAHIFRNLSVIHDLLIENRVEHELIIVDDGSSDDSWAELSRLAKVLPSVRAFRLSRNFGKEAALCAGIEHATGDACVIMDSDLQHPPEIILKMFEYWKKRRSKIIQRQ